MRTIVTDFAFLNIAAHNFETHPTSEFEEAMRMKDAVFQAIMVSSNLEIEPREFTDSMKMLFDYFFQLSYSICYLETSSVFREDFSTGHGFNSKNCVDYGLLSESSQSTQNNRSALITSEADFFSAVKRNLENPNFISDDFASNPFEKGRFVNINFDKDWMERFEKHLESQVFKSIGGNDSDSFDSVVDARLFESYGKHFAQFSEVFLGFTGSKSFVNRLFEILSESKNSAHPIANYILSVGWPIDVYSLQVFYETLGLEEVQVCYVNTVLTHVSLGYMLLLMYTREQMSSFYGNSRDVNFKTDIPYFYNRSVNSPIDFVANIIDSEIVFPTFRIIRWYRFPLSEIIEVKNMRVLKGDFVLIDLSSEDNFVYQLMSLDTVAYIAMLSKTLFVNTVSLHNEDVITATPLEPDILVEGLENFFNSIQNMVMVMYDLENCHSGVPLKVQSIIAPTLTEDVASSLKWATLIRSFKIKISSLTKEDLSGFIDFEPGFDDVYFQLQPLKY